MSEYRKAIGKHMDDIDQHLELLVREHERVVKALKKQIEQLEAENRCLKMFEPKKPYTFPDKPIEWTVTFSDPMEFTVFPDLSFAKKVGDKYVFPDPEFKIILKED